MMPTIEIQKPSAHAAAVEYIRQQLAQGKSLSKLMLEAVDVKSGKAMAFSAVSLDPAEIVQYGQGHTRQASSSPQTLLIEGTAHAAHPIPSAKRQLADTIYALLGSSEDLCLLENPIAQAGDPWLLRAKSRVLFHGGEVYHALLGVDRDQAKIGNAISEAERPPVFIGAVGRAPWPDGTDITSLSTVTAQELASFANTIRCVFVRAYDGEGYLIWKRSNG